MKFALVGSDRLEPFPGGKGICPNPSCLREMLAKCGKVNVWHWAHKGRIHCDSWWENETEWHRNWKNQFSDQNQEIPATDPANDEVHIADVKTDHGLVIEFQNSPISETEARSREAFYRTMIWIVNAENFKKNIILGHLLPDPKKGFPVDVVFVNRTEFDSRLKGAQWYFRPASLEENGLVEMFGYGRDPVLEKNIFSCHDGDFFCHWKNARSVWLGSKVPVYFDFGDDNVWMLRLDHPNAPGSTVLKKFSKQKLIEGIR